jgi:hypothetical protein
VTAFGKIFVDRVRDDIANAPIFFERDFLDETQSPARKIDRCAGIVCAASAPATASGFYP